MKINKIVKLGLEHRIKELKETHSEREIASVLSSETNHKISQSNVHRYLHAQIKDTKNLIEKKETLQAKLVEVEIDTIGRRNKIIEKLEKIADKAEALIEKAELEGVNRKVIEGLKMFLETQKTQISALDSLDKRLGKFTEKREVEVKGAAVIFYIPDNGRDKDKEKLNGNG